MSRRGNCFDNAVVESFFGTLKNEMVNRCRFATRAVARQEVFEYIEVWYIEVWYIEVWYIEVWYNRQRRHSSLGYVSPVEFERRALTGPESLSSASA